MMIEYWYVQKDAINGDDWAEYASFHKGKIPFKTEEEMREGFPQHYPGCVIWSWNYEGELVC
jgi:hypothetical protein